MSEGGPTGDQPFPAFNPSQLYDPTFELGMLFSTRAKLKKVVRSYGIYNKRSIRFTKSTPTRVYAVCDDKDCGWKIRAIKKMMRLLKLITMYLLTLASRNSR